MALSRNIFPLYISNVDTKVTNPGFLQFITIENGSKIFANVRVHKTDDNLFFKLMFVAMIDFKMVAKLENDIKSYSVTIKSLKELERFCAILNHIIDVSYEERSKIDYLAIKSRIKVLINYKEIEGIFTDELQ